MWMTVIAFGFKDRGVLAGKQLGVTLKRKQVAAAHDGTLGSDTLVLVKL
jgi:hypothetical protein